MGSVFIFNTTATRVAFFVNKGPQLAGKPALDQPPYTPFQIIAPFSTNPKPGYFIHGINTFTALFIDFGGQKVPFCLNIPNSISITNDLVLFIYINRAILMQPSTGQLLDSVSPNNKC